MKNYRLFSNFFSIIAGLFFIVGGISFDANASTSNTCIDLLKEGPQTASIGDQISYKFTVKNCGDIKLASGAFVYDPLFGENAIWQGDLMPDETVYFHKTYVVTENDCGELVNTAWADGYPVDGSPIVTDEASWTVKVDCTPHVQPGTGTPGYWKNHSEAWPVDEIMVCNDSSSKDEAIISMSQPIKRDKTITIYKALVAAKLNVFIGNNDTCIKDVIALSDEWFCNYGPVGSEVKASSSAWKIGEVLYQQLDNYNNGLSCAPHRD